MYKQIGNLLLSNRFLIHLHLFKNAVMFLFHLTEQIVIFSSIDQNLENDHWINFKASKPFLLKKNEKNKPKQTKEKKKKKEIIGLSGKGNL